MDSENPVKIEVVEDGDHVSIRTNLFDVIGDYRTGMISSDTLGEAFEPEERFETPDGEDILFDMDYAGNHRGTDVLPGPFADREAAEAQLW